MASAKDFQRIPDSRVEPLSLPPRPRADTPAEGSSQRPPVQVPGKVYQPHYSAKTTTQIKEPSAFGAIQDLKAELKRRDENRDRTQRETDQRLAELERGQNQVSSNDLGHERTLSEVLMRLNRIENIPQKTEALVQKANDDQLKSLQSSKITEYLRLLGVVVGTAIASYLATSRGHTDARPVEPAHTHPSAQVADGGNSY